ncbi:MAG: hypothetical protein LUD18_05595 [Lachnospiraceae bacterium]|nr:hypothetical protein [Lachnospiraceae bacterium]
MRFIGWSRISSDEAEYEGIRLIQSLRDESGMPAAAVFTTPTPQQMRGRDVNTVTMGEQKWFR